MSPTIPVTVSAPPPTVTLDELVARGLTAGELATLSAYQRIAGGALVQWLAKGSE